jgi:hypothetical protein
MADVLGKKLMADCQIEIPKVKGLDDGALTVGRKFLLNCKGPFATQLKPETIKNLKPENLQIQFAEKQSPYSLKILNNQFLTPEDLQLEVTSYTVGPFPAEPLKIKIGEETLELNGVHFEVHTVIEKKDAAVEPYGPVALSMAWPMAVWLAALLLILFISAVVGLRIRRHWQRKSLLEELRQHDSALSPLAEVHKQYRQWRREKSFFYGVMAPTESLPDFLKDLESSLRLFLTRTFKVPALQWNDRLILKDIQKYHPEIYLQWGKDLRRLLAEMSKAREAKNLKSQDVVQLTENFRVLAEKLSKAGGR